MGFTACFNNRYTCSQLEQEAVSENKRGLVLLICLFCLQFGYGDIQAQGWHFLDNDTQIDDPNLTYCAFTDFTIPPQPYHMSGSTGGLWLLLPTNDNGATYKDIIAEDIGNEIVGFELGTTSDGATAKDVVILVVDDFTTKDSNNNEQSVFRVGAGIFEVANLILGESRNFTLAELKELEARAQLSHGALVMNHINTLIEGTSNYTYQEESGNISIPYIGSKLPENQTTSVEIGDSITTNTMKDAAMPRENMETAPPYESVYWQSILHTWRNLYTQKKLAVMAVDVDNFDTQKIISRIESALGEAQRMGFERISVNMSFAIIPCKALEEFNANQFETFDDYINALATSNGINAVEEIGKMILEAVQNDQDLRAFFANDYSGTVFVASAGNFNRDYMTYPAVYPSVVGVSANFADEEGRSFFSNVGEVMTTGAFVEITTPFGNDRFEPKVFYAGTSFAAPNVSFYTALDLAEDVPLCNPIPVNANPDLAHWKDLTQLPGYIDLPLDVAIGLYCQ